MDLKKSPKADLERHKFVFRLIGASIALMLTITVFQWKSFTDIKTHDIVTTSDYDMEELPPILYITDDRKPVKPKSEKVDKTKPPKEPQKMKRLIAVSNQTIVPDAEKDWGIPDHIGKTDPLEKLEPVPYVLVESMPVFPGCEGLKGDDLKACFEQKILAHVSNNFKFPPISKEMGSEGRVLVTFIIDVDGRVKDVQAVQGPDAPLREEGERLVNTLPAMTKPAMQRGKPVPIVYNLPIRVELQ